MCPRYYPGAVIKDLNKGNLERKGLILVLRDRVFYGRDDVTEGSGS